MTMRWTEEETIELVELYKSYQYLWDNSLDLYRNLIARKQAYDAIVKHMGIPGLTPQDVRSKIKNLRSAFHNEMRKQDKLSTVEKMASRKLTWFQALKPIMGNVHNSTKGSVSQSETSEEEEQEESCFIEEPSSSMDAYVVSIKQEYLDEMVHNDDKDIAPVDDYLEIAPKKMRMSEPVNIEIPEPTERSTQSPKPKKLDEFQMFSNNIAAQLRRLPLDRALILQVEVQSLIAKERIRIFKRQIGDPKDDESG